MCLKVISTDRNTTAQWAHQRQQMGEVEKKHPTLLRELHQPIGSGTTVYVDSRQYCRQLGGD